MKKLDWIRFDNFVHAVLRLPNAERVYVVTGAIYDQEGHWFSYDKKIDNIKGDALPQIGEGPSEVRVPYHLYKVVHLWETNDVKSTSAFVIPNRSSSARIPSATSKSLSPIWWKQAS